MVDPKQRRFDESNESDSNRKMSYIFCIHFYHNVLHFLYHSGLPEAPPPYPGPQLQGHPISAPHQSPDDPDAKIRERLAKLKEKEGPGRLCAEMKFLISSLYLDFSHFLVKADCRAFKKYCCI